MPSRDRATLPPKLLEQFRCLRRRLWQTRFLEWSGLVIVALISLFFVVWISDRVWDTPLAWRMALLACIYITLLGFASWLFVRWGLPLTRWTALGNFVRRWNRKSGDRVLAAVSLTEEEAPSGRSRISLAKLISPRASPAFGSEGLPRPSLAQRFYLVLFFC